MENNDAFLNETHYFPFVGWGICDIEISNNELIIFLFKTNTNEK